MLLNYTSGDYYRATQKDKIEKCSLEPYHIHCALPSLVFHHQKREKSRMQFEFNFIIQNVWEDERGT